MRTPLRRWLGVAGLAVCGLTACGSPQPGEPTPPLESSDVLPEVPTPPVQPPSVVQEQTACARLPPGRLPTEALEAVAPDIQLQCGLFPESCAPLALRKALTGAASTCAIHDAFSTTPQYVMEYDAQGRVAGFEGHMDWSERYTYDACGRLASRGWKPAGSMMARGSDWQFGPDGRLLEYAYTFGNTRTVTRYTYGASGELLGAEEWSHYGTMGSWAHGRWNYTLDAQGRIIRAEHVVFPAPDRSVIERIEERSYTPSGELAGLRTTSSGSATTYKAFSEGRLIYEQVITHYDRRENEWTYLPNGLPERVRSQWEAGGKRGTGETVYVYDAHHRLVRREGTSVTSGPDGTETHSRSAELYTRDEDGRLRSLRYTNPEIGQKVWEWQYEGDCY
ncbi:MAG TPA: hypothetical protein VE153_39205 [Myxococcus sp.]|nr:hypothetical protein [Myxococcus sp.]